MPTISVSKRFIMVHPPKTGGTSLTFFFKERGYIADDDWNERYLKNDHVFATRIRSWIDDDQIYGDLRWDQFHSFAVVRNPFDLMISYYFYKQKSRYQKFHREAKAMSFTDFIQFLYSLDLTEYPEDEHKIILGQHQWVTDRSGEVIVNQIIRLEDLADGFREMCQLTNIDYGPLAKLNQTKGPFYDHEKFYDDKTRELVSSRFARDLELFDFEYCTRDPTALSRPKLANQVVQYCSSLYRNCGIASYTRLLCNAQSYVPIVGLADLFDEVPGWIHMQHEFNITQLSEYREVADYCAENDVKLYVTLHSVKRDAAFSVSSVVKYYWRLMFFMSRLMWNKLIWAIGTLRDSALREALGRLRLGNRFRNFLTHFDFNHHAKFQAHIIKTADKLIVHSEPAKQELVRQGAKTVEVVPHPIQQHKISNELHSEQDGLLHVGYFGFMSPSKNLPLLMDACREAGNIVLHMYASVRSYRGSIPPEFDQIFQYAQQHDWIRLHTEHLPLEEVVLRLSKTDVNVYLTQTTYFSVSGAIRQYLAAQRPIIASESPMIDGIRHLINVIPPNNRAKLLESLANFNRDTSPIADYLQSHTWEQLKPAYE